MEVPLVNNLKHKPADKLITVAEDMSMHGLYFDENTGFNFRLVLINPPWLSFHDP